MRRAQAGRDPASVIRAPMRLTLVAGARPNFMKIAPLIRAFSARPDDFAWRLVHTGQHYDHDMNDVFFAELGIPAPHARLGCGGGSHAAQTAAIMVAFEQELLSHPADWLIVVGDVNSTLACSVVASKMNVRIAHVEAGLRSGDRAMPEEINRLVTDSISDLFFTTEPSARAHLLREGQDPKRIHDVGHVMIDNLFHQLRMLQALPESHWAGSDTRALKSRLGVGRYGVVTLHRPSNVDDSSVLEGIVKALSSVAETLPLIFPVHPRTRARLDGSGLELGDNVHLTGPLAYMAFLDLWKDAALVLTDSGGLQEETSALGVRCLTLRNTTERPVTVTDGTNHLAGTDPQRIIADAAVLLAKPVSPRRPPLWDGRSAERIAAVLAAQRQPHPLI